MVDLNRTIWFPKTAINNAVHEGFNPDVDASDITGTDVATGFIWPGRPGTWPHIGTNHIEPLDVVRSFFDHGRDTPNAYDGITPGNVSDYVECTIADEIGPSGGTEKVITINLKQTKGFVPYGAGCVLRLQTMFANTNPVPPKMPNYYHHCYFKLQSDLLSILPVNQLHTITEKKAGGFNGTAAGGDFRIRVGVENINGALKMCFDVDQTANKPGSVTTTPEGYVFIESTTSMLSRFWRVRGSGPDINVNEWYKLEYWYHRHATHGYFVLAINGQVIGENYGRTCGRYDLPFGRISVCSVYTGTNDGTGVNKFAQPELSDFPATDSILYQKAQRYFDKFPEEIPVAA